mmetsp:Transcript_34944/g.58749  ORF Transcript_34944/g.58749 Transcript_34944/m.58749 type:complete len:236 (+) Transcript_34944:496-1203(+)
MVALQNGLMRLRLTLRLEAVEAFLGLGRGFGRLQGPSLLARGFGQRVLGRGRAGRGGLLLWLVALERISIRSHDVGGAEDPPAGAARHIVLGGWRRDATYLGAALADHDNHDGAHYDADNNRSHNADDNSRINSAAAAAAAESVIGAECVISAGTAEVAAAHRPSSAAQAAAAHAAAAASHAAHAAHGRTTSEASSHASSAPRGVRGSGRAQQRHHSHPSQYRHVGRQGAQPSAI